MHVLKTQKGNFNIFYQLRTNGAVNKIKYYFVYKLADSDFVKP